MLNPGAVLQNRYEIIEPIGEGGMGAVYRARDVRLGSMVALKETFFDDEVMRRAFEREARLLAGLRHPALPRVIDHFNEAGGQFLVMEYIAGDDLEALLNKRRGPFSPEEVLPWADQLLDALDYLHGQEPPVIHRDIKPQNMKLTARNQIILLDFGLAKGYAAGMTQSGGKSLYGYTPTYAPMEQIRGVGTDPRSDLYSLGVTLYHLLTGVTPTDALTRANAVLGGQPDPLRPAHEVNAQVPATLGQVLRQATALHSDQRPASAAALRRLLQVAHAGVPGALPELNATIRILPGAPTQPEEHHSDANAPTMTGFTEAATAVLPAPHISQPAPAGATRTPSLPVPVAPLSPPPATPKRWPYALGGVAAAAVLGTSLWAVISSQTNTPGNSLPGPGAANANSVIIVNSNVSAANSNAANSNAANTAPAANTAANTAPAANTAANTAPRAAPATNKTEAPPVKTPKEDKPPSTPVPQPTAQATATPAPTPEPTPVRPMPGVRRPGGIRITPLRRPPYDRRPVSNTPDPNMSSNIPLRLRRIGVAGAKPSRP